MPTEGVLTSWAEQVPDNFIFALKAPQVITHLKRLSNVGSETEYLFRTLPVLDRKLGPVLFQFPKSFHAHLPALEDFLHLIPEDAACAFEFRSPSWLDAGMPELLRKKGCSLCMEDTDDDPVKDIISTADWGYLRLRRSGYSDEELSQWIERILSQKWDKVFVYFKHEDGPEMAVRFHQLVASKLRSGEIKTGTKGR